MVCLHLRKVSTIRVIWVIKTIASWGCEPKNLITFFVLEHQVPVLSKVCLTGNDIFDRKIKIFCIYFERLFVKFSWRTSCKYLTALHLSALNPHCWVTTSFFVHLYCMFRVGKNWLKLFKYLFGSTEFSVDPLREVKQKSLDEITYCFNLHMNFGL